MSHPRATFPYVPSSISLERPFQTLKCIIHRGTNEIGATCVELECDGARLILDVGLPLEAPGGGPPVLPLIPGLREGGDPSLLGILISHPHPDHYGLLAQVAPEVPVFIGEAAGRLLKEAAFFSPMGLDRAWAGHFSHRTPFTLGPFTITPRLNDHSGFDAYGFLVEAAGRRLYYSGDLRGHGRKAGVFNEFLRDPPSDVNVLLLEGTQIREGSDGSEGGPSEKDVEAGLLATFEATEGLALVMFSPQNIDRLVSVYRACIRSGRDLVIDLYAAAMARATGRETIPQAEWDRVRVYLPRHQRTKVIGARAFHRTDAVRHHRIYPEELLERRGELVMLFRGSMRGEVEAMGCLEGAGAVWSMWPGYLEQPSGQELKGCLKRLGIPMVTHHSSGHASIADLVRLAEAMNPERIVPIHSTAADRFQDWFPRVERRQDQEVWQV